MTFFKLKGFNNEQEAVLRKNATVAIKKWVAQLWQLPPDITVMVTEVQCAEPNCPDRETVVAIMWPTQTERHSIRKPLVYVRQWDLQAIKK